MNDIFLSLKLKQIVVLENQGEINTESDYFEADQKMKLQRSGWVFDRNISLSFDLCKE